MQSVFKRLGLQGLVFYSSLIVFSMAQESFIKGVPKAGKTQH